MENTPNTEYTSNFFLILCKIIPKFQMNFIMLNKIRENKDKHGKLFFNWFC